MSARLRVAPWAAALFVIAALATEIGTVVPRMAAMEGSETSPPSRLHPQSDCPFQTRQLLLASCATLAAVAAWSLAKPGITSRAAAYALSAVAVAFIVLALFLYAWSRSRGCLSNRRERSEQEEPRLIPPRAGT